MKTKFLNFILLATVILLLSACDNVERKHYSMPPGEQYEILFGRIKEKLQDEDPYIYEMSGTFKPGSHESYSGSAYFSAVTRRRTSKTGMWGYSYGFETGSWSGPDEIHLYTGGGREKREYLSDEEYKEVLFKRSEMPPFSQFEELYKKAIDSSGFEKDQCFVQKFHMDRYQGEKHFQITVESKEDRDIKRTVIFDMDGNVKETVDGENRRYISATGS